MKAYLTWREIPVRKIHDLTVLLAQCAVSFHAFLQYQEACEILTPYATLFRYPGDVLEPDERDVVEAIELAGKLVEFVCSQLPIQLAD